MPEFSPDVQAMLLGATSGMGGAGGTFAPVGGSLPQQTISSGLAEALAGFAPHGPVGDSLEGNKMLQQLRQSLEHIRVQQQVAPPPQRGAFLVPNKSGVPVVRFFEPGQVPAGAVPYK